MTSKDIERLKDEDLTHAFVSCVDSLNKMKTLAARKNQLGKVPHTYSSQTREEPVCPVNKQQIGREVEKQKAYRLKRQQSSHALAQTPPPFLAARSVLNTSDPLLDGAASSRSGRRLPAVQFGPGNIVELPAKSRPAAAAEHKEFFRRKEEAYRISLRQANKQVLFKVHASNQIDKSHLHELTQEEVEARTIRKLGSVVAGPKQHLFSDLMVEFGKVAAIFGDFRILNIQDYAAYPLDHYDVNMQKIDNMNHYLRNKVIGMSRWVRQDGSTEWKRCYILGYDEHAHLFTIRWTDSPLEKKVSRMNLILPEEDVADFESRRLQSNLLRALSLMNVSLGHKLFTQDILSRCKVYISYSNFKHLIARSAIKQPDYQIIEADSSYIQDIYDEYVVSILKQYIQYKAFDCYEEYVDSCHRAITRKPASRSALHSYESSECISTADPSAPRIFASFDHHPHADAPSTGLLVYELFDHIFAIDNRIPAVQAAAPRQQRTEEKPPQKVYLHKQRASFPNMQAVHAALNNSVLVHMRTYVTAMAKMNHQIHLLAEVNLYAHLHSAYLDSADPDVFRVDPSLLASQVAALAKQIDSIQLVYSTMKDDILSKTQEHTKRLLTQSKLDSLVSVLNNTIEHHLNRMLLQSNLLLVDVVDRLLLSFNIDERFQKKIDFLLPQQLYIQRCKSIIKYMQYPHKIEDYYCFYPTKLYCNFHNQFKRRSFLVKHVLVFLMGKLEANSLRQYQLMMAGSNAGKSVFVHMKLSVKKPFMEKLAKLDQNSKQLLRAMNRKRLYRIKDYIEENRDDFISSMFTKATCSINSAPPLTQKMNRVSASILCEYKLQSPVFDLKPSFAESEAAFKQQLLAALRLIDRLPRLNAERPEVLVGDHNYSFSQCTASLVETLDLFDSCLAEGAMFLVGFLMFINSFSHLTYDTSNLLAEELKLMNDENDLDTLEREVYSMLRDRELVLRLPQVVPVGMYRVDISEVVKQVLANIENTLKNIFMPHIENKFDSLLTVNKERFGDLRDRLCAPAPEIDSYIEMKRFLEGEEVVKQIEHISRDIKLCRRLNSFEENARRSSDLITNEYLESLSWVNELKYHHDFGLKRIKEALPRFRDELMRLHKRLVDEFNQTMIFIREFDSYSDDKEADVYYQKAVGLTESLDGYLHRAVDINAKQEILGLKKSSFDVAILAEKASFNRYFDLWNFIANQWNLEHNLWKKEPFVKLDKNDMNRVISSGLVLLHKLQDSFRDNEVVHKLIKNKQDEVKKFNNVMEVVKILKDPSFKDRHWDDLFSHIKEADKNDSLGLRESRPDLNKLTLGQLMLANVMAHTGILKQIQYVASCHPESQHGVQDRAAHQRDPRQRRDHQHQVQRVRPGQLRPLHHHLRQAHPQQAQRAPLHVSQHARQPRLPRGVHARAHQPRQAAHHRLRGLRLDRQHPAQAHPLLPDLQVPRAREVPHQERHHHRLPACARRVQEDLPHDRREENEAVHRADRERGRRL